MQELLKDPETLAFVKGRDLSLGTLKKEIDRRFVKIKNMLGQTKCPQNHRPETVNWASQTQQFQSCQTSTIPLSLTHVPVLTVHNPNLLRHDEDHPKNNLPRSGVQKYQLERQQSLENISENDSLKEKPEYMSAKKDSKNTLFTSNLVSGRPSFESNMSSKRPPFASRDKELKVRPILKLKSDKKSDYFENMVNPCFYIDLKNNDDVHACESVIEYSENQDRQERPSLCTKGKQTTSRRNLKFTDRTSLPEPQKRITVSDECQMKMMNLVWQIIPQKRRENIDTNLRCNVIRKIDEKYGDYFENI